MINNFIRFLSFLVSNFLFFWASCPRFLVLAHAQDEVSGKLCFFSFLFFFSPTSQDHHILMSFIYTKLGKTTPKWKKERESKQSFLKKLCLSSLEQNRDDIDLLLFI